jgi:glutamyl-tRNA synthetase
MSYFKEVRVRIAPSPTGDPHVGTAYVALFNYVFAKKNQGKFLLRIEDTDQVRAKSSSEAMIMQSLRWLGLTWDEGPDKPGPYGPYRQSERTAIYREHTEILIKTGHAYRCFCTAERLEAVRAKQREAGVTTAYDRHCRGLSAADVEANMRKQLPHVVRLKMPVSGVTSFTDEIRGLVEIENTRMDDQVLLKSDGYPTYHLANVVDDHLMKISHVIRAEEWINSTPKHVVLYDAFGWEKPKFAHLPLLRNADKSKISKRKNPVALTYYQRAGVLPEALVNFLANMGWSFGNDVEFFSVDDMVKKFEFKNIHLGGPVFDTVKLTWMNQHYMHKMTEDRFVEYVRNEIFSESYLRQMKPYVLERMSRFEQFVDNNFFFFNGALDYAGLEIIPKGKTPQEI